MRPLPLVPVWVVQDATTGHFLGRDLTLETLIRDAGRIYSEQEARDTAVMNFGGEWELFQFYEFE